ncbi:MAG: winged helix-turn-helix domain-containing protein [Algicola sp.]|nr:winged helix-turn-helix domain-containing protein [Algicola sp.]
MSNYQVGQWQVLVDENRLSPVAGADIEAQTLLPKVMTLLLYFIENPNRLLTFDELNQAVWPKEVVGDNAIYNLIGQLRKVLGDKASKPEYIETLSKKGYRLIALVKVISAESMAPGPSKEASVIEAKTASNKKWWVTASLGFVLLVLLSFTAYLWQSNDKAVIYSAEELPDIPRQHFTLAMFHQHKHSQKHTQKAIEYLQQTQAVVPQFLPAYIELGYANLWLALRNPQAKSLLFKKVQVLSDKAMALDDQAIDSRLLAACLKWFGGDKQALTDLAPALLKSKTASTSSRLAVANILFIQSNRVDAIKHQELAVSGCPDCASAYYALATSQSVAMALTQAFKNYDKFLELSAYEGDNPMNLANLNRLTTAKLSAMNQWIEKAPTPAKLLTHQRNTLALFYLSLGKQAQAQKLMNDAQADKDSNFFTLYTQAAVAGAKKDFERTTAMLLKRHEHYPDNRRFAFSLALAYLMIDQTDLSFELLTTGVFEVPPTQPSNTDDIKDSEFHRWSLYGTLLIRGKELGEELEGENQGNGQKIMALLEAKITSGLMATDIQSNMTYASILALQGKTEQALSQIKQVLEGGWVADFNLNWWHLEDDPYLQSLKDEPAFIEMVGDYHRRIGEISGD